MLSFALLAFVGLVSAQDKKCDFNFTLHNGQVFELDLSPHVGDIHWTSDAHFNFIVSLCNNSIDCTNNGVLVHDMISAYPQGIIECLHLATYDNDQTTPFYDFGSASWFFNYTNGGKCTSTENYHVMLFFNCHPGAKKPFLQKAFHFGRCGFAMEMAFEGACEPVFPDNEKCIFHGRNDTVLDLSSLKGIDITTKDRRGHDWHFTPCANGLKCAFPSGNSIDTMAQINDEAGNCAKFLGLWSGDVQAHHFEHNGTEAWGFHWFDGLECSVEEPFEMFGAVYKCDPSVDTYKVNGTHAHRCRFVIEINTKHACTSGQIEEYDTMWQLPKGL